MRHIIIYHHKENIKMNILLIHQYAGNKGDRAVLYATCSIIRSIAPSIHISVSTSSPELWEGYSYYQEQQIEFIPSAWDYTRIPRNKKYWNIINKIKNTLLRSCVKVIFLIVLH